MILYLFIGLLFELVCKLLKDFGVIEYVNVKEQNIHPAIGIVIGMLIWPIGLFGLFVAIVIGDVKINGIKK